MSDPGSPYKIALLMQDFSGGGAERMMINVAEGLASRGHDVEIVTVRPEGPYLDRIPSHIPVVTLGPRRVSRAIPALARYLRRRRPDAALSTLVHMNVAAVLAKRISRTRTRMVIREVNPIQEEARAERRPLIRLSHSALPTVYAWADHIIGISEAIAEEVRELVALPAGRVTAVRNPVLGARDLAAIAKTEPRPHPWLGGDVPVVLSVGRLVPQKDHATLLEAFARLRSERQARLVILGDGRLRDTLEARARELGITEAVMLPGFSDNPYAWMKHAAVFAHTARWEGFGNVLVEALACGLPVVATDCPGGPREVLDGGRYGCLVPMGDPTATAEGLAKALDYPPNPKRLRDRAAEYTVDAVIPEYERILLGGR